MFSLLPLALCFYCFCFQKNRNLPVICIGIMSAVITCAIRMIFFYPHRIVPFSFSENLVYLLVKECFLPAVILYGVFFIISKDSVEYKINSIFSLEISFYLVYLPYVLFNSSSGFGDMFSVICKPIIYVAMFSTIRISAMMMYRKISEKKDLWLIPILIIVIAVYMVGPAIIESIYLMNTKLSLAVIFTICYSGFPAVYGILKILKILRAKEDELSLFSTDF